MAEEIKHRLLRYLNDAYAVEVGGIASLKDIAEEAVDSEVRATVTDHITVTQSQADRLEARIIALGGEKSEGKNLIDKIIGKGSNLLNIFHDKDDKQTQDVIKSYSLGHFEIGMYTALKAFADVINDYETAQLADTLMAEEQLAAERLQRLIPKIAKSAAQRTTATDVTV